MIQTHCIHFLIFLWEVGLLSCQLKREPTREEPFINFDVESKKNISLPSCHWSYEYNIAKSVISGLCFAMGAFMLILGYRRRKISFGFIGLTSVSILTYMVLAVEAKFSLLINILIAVATGLFASVFTTMLLYCGYFMTGLFAGFCLGFTFLLIYSTFDPINSVALSCVIIASFGLVQVFITMWWRHRVFIVSCCLFSSAVMASSIDYFIEDLFIFRYMEMKIFYNRVAELCWWSYLVFAIWPLLFIIGILVQCLVTGKEKQKEEYTFIYRRNKQSRRYVQDDQNHLIRYGADV